MKNRMKEINMNWNKCIIYWKLRKIIVKFGQCLEPMGVGIGFGATNIQSRKERLMKMVKTEGHFDKDINSKIMVRNARPINKIFRYLGCCSNTLLPTDRIQQICFR